MDRWINCNIFTQYNIIQLLQWTHKGYIQHRWIAQTESWMKESKQKGIYDMNPVIKNSRQSKPTHGYDVKMPVTWG